MDLLIAILFLCFCYFVGKKREEKHYKNIKEREVKLYKQPYISFSKHIKTTKKVVKSQLISSSVCLGCDYFKAFVASLRNLFGGNVSAYETVLDRARREAILRVREKAQSMRMSIVTNLKIETVMLVENEDSKNNNFSYPKVCITAYGTGIKYEEPKL